MLNKPVVRNSPIKRNTQAPEETKNGRYYIAAVMRNEMEWMRHALSGHDYITAWDGVHADPDFANRVTDWLLCNAACDKCGDYLEPDGRSTTQLLVMSLLFLYHKPLPSSEAQILRCPLKHDSDHKTVESKSAPHRVISNYHALTRCVTRLKFFYGLYGNADTQWR